MKPTANGVKRALLQRAKVERWFAILLDGLSHLQSPWRSPAESSTSIEDRIRFEWSELRFSREQVHRLATACYILQPASRAMIHEMFPSFVPDKWLPQAAEICFPARATRAARRQSNPSLQARWLRSVASLVVCAHDASFQERAYEEMLIAVRDMVNSLQE